MESEPSSSKASQPLRSRVHSEGHDDDNHSSISSRVRNNLGIEDSTYLLQRFERNAFRAVVTAFRAQGPLTPYKELILEHLKFALFIRDHDYITDIQEAADEPIVKNLCKALNVSYSCSDEWRKLAFTAHNRKGGIIRDALTSNNPNNPPNRSKLITTIGSHNVNVSELDLATAKLCVLKKERWVPQALRREIFDTEAANGRVDIDPIDVSETEFEHEMDFYEERRDRVENEKFAAEYIKRRRLAKGKKLTAAEKRKRREKAPLPPFYDETLRAQARAVLLREERIANGDDIQPGALSDGLTEEVQERAEQNMMKFINETVRASSASPVRQPVIPTIPQSVATTSKSAPSIVQTTPIVAPTPPTPPQPIPIISPRPVPTPAPAPADTASTSFNSTFDQLRQQVMSAVAEVRDAVAPPPVKRGKRKASNAVANPRKATPVRRSQIISDSQRELDESLVLEKTAQAMIEDLENAATAEAAPVSMDISPVIVAPPPPTPSTSSPSIINVVSQETPEKSPVIHVVSPVKPIVRPPENGVAGLKRPINITPVRVTPQRPLPKITPCEAPAPPKKRGRRPADTLLLNANCARLQPFVFDEVRPDGSKAPRGNPDKRYCSASKRVGAFGTPPIHPKAMIAKSVPNGVASAVPGLQQSSEVSSPSRPQLPKSAIVPASAIVIRPRANSISSGSPGNAQLTPQQVPVIEAVPAKRMRYVSETNSSGLSSLPSTSTNITGQNSTLTTGNVDGIRGIPIVRQTGRPTLFRPPNVVFPRASNALNNGNPRYVVPHSSQGGGSPSRPYYPTTTFTPRTRTGERPVLLSLTRNPSPQTTVRFVTSGLNDVSKAVASVSNPELTMNGPIRPILRPNGPSRPLVSGAPFSKTISQGDGLVRPGITIIRPEPRHRFVIPAVTIASTVPVCTPVSTATSMPTVTSTSTTSSSSIVLSPTKITEETPVETTSLVLPVESSSVDVLSTTDSTHYDSSDTSETKTSETEAPPTPIALQMPLSVASPVLQPSTSVELNTSQSTTPSEPSVSVNMFTTHVNDVHAAGTSESILDVQTVESVESLIEVQNLSDSSTENVFAPPPAESSVEMARLSVSDPAVSVSSRDVSSMLESSAGSAVSSVPVTSVVSKTPPLTASPVLMGPPSQRSPREFSDPLASTSDYEYIDELLEKTVKPPPRPPVPEPPKKSPLVRAVSAADTPATVFELAPIEPIRAHGIEPIRINIRARPSSSVVIPGAPSPSASLDEVLITQAFFELPPPPPPPPDTIVPLPLSTHVTVTREPSRAITVSPDPLPSEMFASSSTTTNHSLIRDSDEHSEDGPSKS